MATCFHNTSSRVLPLVGHVSFDFDFDISFVAQDGEL
jgi:hypothetical protein